MERNEETKKTIKRKLEEVITEEMQKKKIKSEKPNDQEIKTLKHEKAITCLQFSKKGEYLATGCKIN